MLSCKPEGKTDPALHVAPVVLLIYQYTYNDNTKSLCQFRRKEDGNGVTIIGNYSSCVKNLFRTG